MTALRQEGLPVTTKSLFTTLGRRGSFSTLTRLRKEVEAERPDLVQPNGLSRSAVVAFIEGCERCDLPALEEAMKKRRRVIRIVQNHLCLEIHPTTDAEAILDVLGAKERQGLGWTLRPTRLNYARAKEHGFTSNIEGSIIRELERIEAQNEIRRG